ncbi:MAG TPA: hypothetical protein VKB59_07690 [Micromonosporaceae bacterium]|nr:hypothetical protein [Micromonosporaceae bacterium]
MIDNAAARDWFASGAIPSQRSDTDAERHWSEHETLLLPTVANGHVEPSARAAMEADTEAFVTTPPATTPPATPSRRYPMAVPRHGAAPRSPSASTAPTAPSASAAPSTSVAASAASALSASLSAPAPTGRPSDDHDLGDRLPSSERKMLIFVAMLLAVGAVAVIATMGLGKFG